MLTVAPDFARRIEIEGAGACHRPVDIDRSHTGFSRLVSLRVYSFVAGAVIDGEAETDEVFVVLMRGQAGIGIDTADGLHSDHRLNAEGGRRAVYLPPRSAYRLHALSDCDVAYARAAPLALPVAAAASFGPVEGRLDVPDHALGMSLTLASAGGGAPVALSRPDGRAPERFVHLRGDGAAVAGLGDERLGDWDSAILQDGESATLAVERGTVDLLLISASARPEHSPEHPIDDDNVGINHSKK